MHYALPYASCSRGSLNNCNRDEIIPLEQGDRPARRSSDKIESSCSSHRSKEMNASSVNLLTSRDYRHQAHHEKRCSLLTPYSVVVTSNYGTIPRKAIARGQEHFSLWYSECYRCCLWWRYPRYLCRSTATILNISRTTHQSHGLQV